MVSFGRGPVRVTQNSQQEIRVSANPPLTNREWKRPWSHAQTAEEFQTLSNWCLYQAGICQRRQTEFEAKLRDYLASEHHYNPPKQVTREDERIKREIEACKKGQRHWNDLAALYDGKVRSLAAPVPVRQVCCYR
jgi:hypothetical protein